MAAHLTGLSDEVSGEVAVDDPVDRVERKDLASDEGTLDFLDEVVVPAGVCFLAKTSLVGGLGGVHVAVLDHHEDYAERVRDDGALRRADNVDFATKDKDKKANEEDAKTQKVCRPEVNVAFHVRCGKQRERSGVDAPVENLRRLVQPKNFTDWKELTM